MNTKGATYFENLDYYPIPERTNVYNFSENVLTRERNNSNLNYDFRIGAANVTRQNDSALLTLPITAGVQLISATAIPHDQPERVSLTPFRNIQPEAFTISSQNANYLWKNLLTGNISNANTMLCYAYEYHMVYTKNAVILQDGIIQTMAKVPENMQPSEEIRLFCGNLAKAIWTVIKNPCTFKHTAYEQFELFNTLWDADSGYEVKLSSASVDGKVYPIRVSDFENWIWSTNIWAFLTANDVGLKYKDRVRFLALIMALKYGKKPQTRGSFSSAEQQSHAIVPDDQLPRTNREDGLWYQHEYYTPWCSTLAAMVLRVAALWARDVDPDDSQVGDESDDEDLEIEADDNDQDIISTLDDLRTTGDA